MSSEGLIGNNKNNVGNMKLVHASEPGMYFHFFWKALRTGASYMMNEADRCDSYIEERRKRSHNKTLKKREESDDESMTEDFKEMKETDDSHMVWDRKSRGKNQWKIKESEMRQDLKAALKKNGVAMGSNLLKVD